MPFKAYDLFMKPAFEGMVASSRWSLFRSSMEEAVNASGSTLTYGRAVVLKPGGRDGELILPNAAGLVFKGVTYKNELYEKLDTEGYAGYPDKEPVGYVAVGDIWVYTEQAVTPFDPVYFRHTAGTAPNTQLGRFRKDADGGLADAATNVCFLRSTTGPGLVLIAIN